MKYILASASPRRRELLTQAGIEYTVIPSKVEEKISKTIPSDVVMELALLKAEDVFDRHGDEDCTVIGADTVVVYRNEILGKPGDEEEACDMLSMLSDRTHQVYTGVALVSMENGQKKVRTFYERTDVTFFPVSREEIASYAATGDPLDKAGAYGIQGPFAVHIRGIQGDYNNVVGLPIARLYQELKKDRTKASAPKYKRLVFEE